MLLGVQREVVALVSSSPLCDSAFPSGVSAYNTIQCCCVCVCMVVCDDCVAEGRDSNPIDDRSSPSQSTARYF
jgi:hypothetical protein